MALEHAVDTTAAPPPPSVPRGQPTPAVVQAQAHAVACGINGGSLNFQSSDPPTQSTPPPLAQTEAEEFSRGNLPLEQTSDNRSGNRPARGCTTAEHAFAMGPMAQMQHHH